MISYAMQQHLVLDKSRKKDINQLLKSLQTIKNGKDARW